MSDVLEKIYTIWPQFRSLDESFLRELIVSYSELPKLDNEKYALLHENLLTPTDIKIDVDAFKKEIKEYDEYFGTWGKNWLQYPRYGIPLVNLTGKLTENSDPSRMPLDEYIMLENKILHDVDVTKKTPLAKMNCLQPLDSVLQYAGRSSILKWDSLGHFKPHADVVLPAPNLRIWGTTSANLTLKIDNTHIKNIEPGRIYVIDTSKIHEAWANENEIYQFFISLTIDSYETLYESCRQYKQKI